MKFPQKIEINVENELQAALLYSCFNKNFNDVMLNLKNSRKPYAKDLYYKYKNITNDNDNFIMKCWEKINNIFEKNKDCEKIKNNENKRLAKIKVELFFKDNEEYYRILGFENIRKEKQLPTQYLNSCPKFYLSSLIGESSIYVEEYSNSNHITIGDEIKKSKFNEIFKIIKEAGERLTQLRKKEKSVNEFIGNSNIIKFII